MDRRAWLPPIVVTTVALTVFLAHGVDGTLEHDEAVAVYTSSVVADGSLPYVDAFDNTGPLGPWYGGAAVTIGRLVGASDITSARVAYLPVALAIALVLYLVARAMRFEPWVAATAALSIVALPAFAREALSGPRPKLLVALLEVAMLLAVTRRRWLVAGVCAGLAALTWQVAAVTAVVPLVASVRSASDRLERLARVATGALAPVGVIVAVYAAAGRLAEMWEGAVTWNVRYTAAARPERTLLERTVEPARDLVAADVLSWPIAVVGVIGLAIAVLRRRSDATWLGAAILAGVWLAWTWFDEQSVVDLLPLLPLLALGFALAASRLGSRATLVVVALIVALGVAETVRTREDGLVAQRAAVGSLVRAGADVSSYDRPEILAIAGGRNPSRFFFRVPGLDRYLADRGATDAYVRALTSDVDVVAARITPAPTDPVGRELVIALTTGFRPVRAAELSAWVRREPAGPSDSA